MTDHYPLDEYQPGEKFNSIIVAVRSAKALTDKNGRFFVDLKLGDWSGTRSAKFWKATDADVQTLCAAEFLEVSGEVDASDLYAGDFSLKRYAVAERPADVTPFLGVPRETNREYKQRFGELVRSITDPELHYVLKQIFKTDIDFCKKFYRAIAANNVHHAFPGGLLEHTVEVAELCSHTCEVLKGLDRDLLVTGAILHDIGKMEEMDQELRAGEYTEDGCLIGHLVIGSVRVSQAIDKHNETCADGEKISAGTKRALMHLILSHHGLPDHGAARRPAFAEATVLYLCDNISAKSRIHLDLLASNTAGGTSAFNKFLDTVVYLKPPRDLPKGDSPDLPDFLPTEDGRNTQFVTAVTLPVLGLVAAGSPNPHAEQQPLEYRRAVPPPAGADYLLQVAGDSMTGAGVHDGDVLFVKKQDKAGDGDIVVATIAGEGQTLKRLRTNPNPEKGMAGPYLEAANPKYSPVLLASGAKVQGKVTGLLRDF